MKDHLETAPVIDAVRSKDGCPICRLRGMIETQTVERYLGGAVMEPFIHNGGAVGHDIRVWRDLSEGAGFDVAKQDEMLQKSLLFLKEKFEG